MYSDANDTQIKQQILSIGACLGYCISMFRLIRPLFSFYVSTCKVAVCIALYHNKIFIVLGLGNFGHWPYLGPQVVLRLELCFLRWSWLRDSRTIQQPANTSNRKTLFNTKKHHSWSPSSLCTRDKLISTTNDYEHTLKIYFRMSKIFLDIPMDEVTFLRARTAAWA